MEDYYTHRNQGHRYSVVKIDDSKDIQLVDGNGLADEQHTQLMRLYPHGFSSHSVKDAHFLALGLGGRRDLLIALGGEHHEKRPKNIPEGDTVLYNAEGDVIRIFGKNTIDITHSKNIKLSIGKGLKDSSGGQGSSGSQGKDAAAGEDKDVTMVFTENDITITKGKGVIKLTKSNITTTYDDTVVTQESGKITHKAPTVVIDSPHTLLGSPDASLQVKLCDDSCATRVFAS